MQQQTEIQEPTQPLLASVICSKFVVSWWSLASIISNVYAAKHRATSTTAACS